MVVISPTMEWLSDKYFEEGNLLFLGFNLKMKLLKSLISKIKIKFKSYKQNKQIEKILKTRDPFIYK